MRNKSAGNKKSTFTGRPLVKNQWNPERGGLISKPEETEENLTKERLYRKNENKKCDPKHRSKSTSDDTRRESEENPDLLRAPKYLKEHGYEESEDDEPRPSPSPEPQARPHNRQRVEQYECGKTEVTDGKTGICFNFEKKGAC